MKKQIKKETLKKAIRITVKRYKIGDSDFVTLLLKQCDYISEQVFGNDGYNIRFSDFKERKGMNITYETFYKVFELFGFEIVDEEEKMRSKLWNIIEQ